MKLASAYSKTTSAWAVGSTNGSLDTGSIANSTWYHVFLIRRPDTGVVDILTSTSATAPTMPTNYTQKRRVGMMLTNGSAQWIQFVQNGDHFDLTTPSLTVNNVTPTSGATNTIAVCGSGVIVVAKITAVTSYVSGATTALFVWSPSLNQPQLAQVYSLSGLASASLLVTTNSSGQVKSLLSYGGSVAYNLEVNGWIDRRGQG